MGEHPNGKKHWNPSEAAKKSQERTTNKIFYDIFILYLTPIFKWRKFAYNPMIYICYYLWLQFYYETFKNLKRSSFFKLQTAPMQLENTIRIVMISNFQ